MMIPLKGWIKLIFGIATPWRGRADGLRSFLNSANDYRVNPGVF